MTDKTKEALNQEQFEQWFDDNNSIGEIVPVAKEDAVKILLPIWQASHEATIKEYEAKQSSGGEVVAWQFLDDGLWWNGGNEQHKENTIEGGYKVRDLFTYQPDQSARIAELENNLTSKDNYIDMLELNNCFKDEKLETLTADNQRLREDLGNIVKADENIYNCDDDYQGDKIGKLTDIHFKAYNNAKKALAVKDK